MAIKISGSTIIDDSRVLINTGNVGVGTTDATSVVDANNTSIVHAGVVTANYYYGDGSKLSNLNASQVGALAGVTIQEEGSPVGTAGSVGNINFVSSNLTATASGVGATITLSDTPSFTSVVVGSAVTINSSGIDAGVGVITASSFVGDGTGITGLTASQVNALAGVTIQEEGSTVGTAGSVGNINFVGDNLTATASGAGATITLTETPEFDNLTVTGVSTFQSDIHLDNDDRIYLGTSDDLEIFHNGNGVIRDNGTGNLFFQSNGAGVYFQKYDSGGPNENLARFLTDGAVELYYDGTKKFETTANGIAVAGVVTAISGIVTYYGDGSNLTGISAGFEPDADENLVAGTDAGANLDGTDGCFNVFIGSCAGQSTTSGNSNTFIGRQAGCSNTCGTSNVFLGNNVGSANTTGTKNIYIGSAIADNAVSSCANANIVIGQLAAKCISGNCNIILGCCTGGVGATLTGNHNFIAGYCAGKLQTTGDNNLIIGQNAGQSNTGSDNVMFGTSAGNGNTGSYNFFTGSNAGANNTGNSNNFIGQNVGLANTTGSCNNMMGVGAGRCATVTGSHNNFFGTYAGKCASGAGNYNNFIGFCAGLSNTTGDCNVFIGNHAGTANTTAQRNIMIGDAAGDCATLTNSNNVFLGSCAGKCATGDSCYNNFIGHNAGFSNDGGEDNNFFGRYVGRSNTTGSQNIFIGLTAGCNNITGSCNNMIGVGAGRCATVTGPHNNFFGTYAGKCASGAGKHNNFIGFCAGLSNTTGAYNTFIGCGAGERNTTGDCSIAIGFQAGKCGNSNKSIFIGRYAGKGCLGATGTTNIAIGDEAGTNLASGTSNIFLGDKAAAGESITGTKNTTIGLCAGYRISSGSSNVFVGNYAGKCVTTGGSNIFLGVCSGCGTGNKTGCHNIGLGKFTGQQLTSGSCNIFLGWCAGNTTTSGSCNIAIGKDVELPSATGNGQLAIGDGTNRWITGDSSFNVTIANKLLVNASGIVTASSGIVTYYGDGSNLTGLSDTTRTVNTYTATAGQTTFSATYTVGYIDVFLNGVKLSENEYTATNGTSIVLDTGASLGDIVETVGFSDVNLTNASTISLTGPYTQTVVSLATTDVNLSSGNYFTKAVSAASTFTFSNPPSSGTVQSFTVEIDVTGTNTTIDWPNEVEWNGNSAPTLTDTRTHLFMFVTRDGGSTYRGSALVDYTT